MNSYVLISVIVLSLVVPLITFFKWRGLPAIIAFLTAGMALSPNQISFIENAEGFKHIAEIGVIFLMFSLGLEFNISKLKSIRKWVFGLGTIQMLGTLAFFVMYGLILSDWVLGFVIGSALAMSSTAIISKIMYDKLELNSPHGRQTIGVLLFQDLAVVPLLILWPALANGGDVVVEMGVALLKTLIILALIFTVGGWLLNRWMRVVAKRNSLDLYVFNALWLILLTSVITGYAGLSYALGGFLAGMLISETKYRHQVEADMKAFKDVGIGLFFVSIGMELDFSYIINHGFDVFKWLFLLLVVKIIITYIGAVVLGSKRDPALKTAIHISFAGEFGFILLTQANGYGIMPNSYMQPIISAMLMSMFLAPIVIEKIYQFLGRIHVGSEVVERHGLADNIKDHVVLCGYGRSGHLVAENLSKVGMIYIAIELDLLLYKKAERDGRMVVYGDATKTEVLNAAHVLDAKLVILTFDNPVISVKAANTLLHSMGYKGQIIVRCADEKITRQLHREGINEVVSEIGELSKVISAKSLMALGVDEAHAWQMVNSQAEQSEKK